MISTTNTLGPIPFATVLPGTNPDDIISKVSNNLMPHSIRRSEAIATMLNNNQFNDEMQATLHYDFQHAPLTTNFDMLQFAGVLLVSPEDIYSTGGSFSFHLNHLIHCLSAINVFLVRTNHLSDEQLYTKLWEGPLKDEVRFLPPTAGVSEFIDLSVTAGPMWADAPAVSNRDATLPNRHAYPKA